MCAGKVIEKAGGTKNLQSGEKVEVTDRDGNKVVCEMRPNGSGFTAS